MMAHDLKQRARRMIRIWSVSLVASAAVTAGCAMDSASFDGVLAASDRSTLSATSDAAPGGIVESTPLASIDERAMRQRLLTAPRPPEVIAQGLGDLGEALTYAARAASTDPDRVRGGRWREAAQIGLLFGAPEGKAFLSADQGRALVRGAPAESCPVLRVAAAPTDDQATEGALRDCLASLNDRPDCGCRVIARGDRLLAPHDAFGYAIGVSGHLIDPDSGAEAVVAVEERMIEGAGDARRLWLLGPGGPIGMMQVAPDGRAALIMSGTGRRFDGKQLETGFRRGRIARRAYLTDAQGRRLVVLIGFEDAELRENRAALAAWNPNGPLELKRADASE